MNRRELLESLGGAVTAPLAAALPAPEAVAAVEPSAPVVVTKHFYGCIKLSPALATSGSFVEALERDLTKFSQQALEDRERAILGLW